ncbi:MAG TPA: damage-inducible protein [Dongiaceae bacterium]|nr:damage-inducible protein [Dongiaceae bacterium]
MAALRQQLAGRLVGPPQGQPTPPSGPSSRCLPLGLSPIDAHLGGGLAQGALHEIAGCGPDAELALLPAFFATQLILRHHDQRVIWIAATPDLYGPGLSALGLDPTRLLLVESRQETESLWALEEAARSGAVSLVIGEIDLLDLTASRRLQLAAEEKNCTVLALRRSRLMGKGDKHRQPSAATTRWLISPLASRPIGTESRPGLGLPGWHLHLWRQRNGPPGSWDITLPDQPNAQDQSWQLLAAEPQRQTAMAANDDTKLFSSKQYGAPAG